MQENKGLELKTCDCFYHLKQQTLLPFQRQCRSLQDEGYSVAHKDVKEQRWKTTQAHLYGNCETAWKIWGNIEAEHLFGSLQLMLSRNEDWDSLQSQVKSNNSAISWVYAAIWRSTERRQIIQRTIELWKLLFLKLTTHFLQSHMLIVLCSC